MVMDTINAHRLMASPATLRGVVGTQLRTKLHSLGLMAF